jgi:hypothetical protein
MKFLQAWRMLLFAVFLACRAGQVDAQGTAGNGNLCGKDFATKVKALTNEEANQMTELNCQYTNFNSALPSQIARLSELTRLRLTNCGIQGTLPPQLYQLTKLKIL